MGLRISSAILRFPGDRLATFTCSFGTAKISIYQVVGTNGDLRVEPAYTSQGEIEHVLSIEGDKQKRSVEGHDQLAAVFVYFSDCILQDKEPEPSGAEGLIDVQLIRALDESLSTGGFVTLVTLRSIDRASAINRETRASSCRRSGRKYWDCYRSTAESPLVPFSFPKNSFLPLDRFDSSER
jgi:hypothetical protein